MSNQGLHVLERGIRLGVLRFNPFFIRASVEREEEEWSKEKRKEAEVSIPSSSGHQLKGKECGKLSVAGEQNRVSIPSSSGHQLKVSEEERSLGITRMSARFQSLLHQGIS